MYIAKQNVSGRDYFYIRKSVREGDKVKSKMVAYGGKTWEDAEEKLRELEKGDDFEEIKISIEELGSFCKRKGFVYPSGELYGGLGGFWDYGVLGVELKNNIKGEWWGFHVRQRDDMGGIDGAIVTNPKVWEASGHVGSFVDVAVVNKKTGEKFKVDKHEVAEYEDNDDFEVRGEFNPMFTTKVGPVEEDSLKAYLRPETAQLIFANFKSVWENARLKLPCGIAQVGKAFRNEISPREFIFRSREFEQMEIEYFIAPDADCPYIEDVKGTSVEIYSEEMQKAGFEKGDVMDIYDAWKNGVIKNPWHAYWISVELEWFLKLGANKNKFRVRQHVSDERSHYSSDTWDLEFEFPMGWRELEGFADRSDYDLRQHEKFSKKSMEVDDPKYGKVVPHVVCEPSLGVERAFLVFMLSSYTYDSKRDNVVLKLNPKIAPVKAAVFPIIKKSEYEEIADKIVKDLRKKWNIVYDRSGSIGRRYARNDEIGTPMCITIDDKTPEDDSVTIRDRDSTNQVRVKIKDLKKVVQGVVDGKSLLKFGERVETRVKE